MNNLNSNCHFYIGRTVITFFCRSTNDQTGYERALEKELLIFEALEQKSQNDSFCSTNSSVLRILSSSPRKVVKKHEEKRVHFDQQSDCETIETSLDTNQIGQIFERLQRFADMQKDRATCKSLIEALLCDWLVFVLVPPIGGVSSEEGETSTDDDVMTSSVCSSDLDSTLEEETNKQMVVGGEELNKCQCSDVLKKQLEEKIAEFEKKVRTLLSDQMELDQIKRELEFKTEKFGREMNRIKEEFEEEKEEFLSELKREKEKMMQEKNNYLR